MRTTTILLGLAALLIGGCYAYESRYYEPPTPAATTVTYVESPETAYVRYAEPSVVYVRYYDPWWYTPVSWGIWCDFCFCHHKHYYDCPRYSRTSPVPTVRYSDPPRTYLRDSSDRQHYSRVSSTPRRSAPAERLERVPARRTRR